MRIVLEGTDSFDNMFGSVYYSDGNNTKDLALELVENVHVIILTCYLAYITI